MLKVICVEGRNVQANDSIGAYCSKKLKDLGVSRISSIGEDSRLVFDIDQNNDGVIHFTSDRSFTALGPQNVKYQRFVEEGNIELFWEDWHYGIQNCKSIPTDYKYQYFISISDGTIYLSSVALSKLIAAIDQEYEEIIRQKKESRCLEFMEDLAFLQTPWSEFEDVYQKVQLFAKTYALPIFTDIHELAAFELNFKNNWLQNSNGKDSSSLILQTNLNQLKQLASDGHRLIEWYKIRQPLPKFEALVRLVSASCHWDESYAAVRTYGALLASVKNESKNQCNITYNFKIEPDWPYEDCLKNYITCVKELYKDPVCFGCFVYYLMLEQKIPLPPKSERIPEHLGFQYAYKKVKEDIAPLAKDFFDNLEVLQLEKELASDSSRSTMAVEDYDLMSGQEFEQAIAKIFKNMGYQVTMTPTTGDQGIDIIAVRNGIRIGIQAKCYTGKVGNSAVQEVVAGKQYYNLNRCMVVTNSTFTSAAVALAKANNVTLWDRHVLEEKLLSLSCEESD